MIVITLVLCELCGAEFSNATDGAAHIAEKHMPLEASQTDSKAPITPAEG